MRRSLEGETKLRSLHLISPPIPSAPLVVPTTPRSARLGPEGVLVLLCQWNRLGVSKPRRTSSMELSGGPTLLGGGPFGWRPPSGRYGSFLPHELEGVRLTTFT